MFDTFFEGPEPDPACLVNRQISGAAVAASALPPPLAGDEELDVEEVSLASHAPEASVALQERSCTRAAPRSLSATPSATARTGRSAAIPGVDTSLSPLTRIEQMMPRVKGESALVWWNSHISAKVEYGTGSEYSS